MVPKFPRNSWDVDESCTNFLGISGISAEQMTDFLGFCRHSCDVAKCLHWMVPKFPRNLRVLMDV